MILLTLALLTSADSIVSRDIQVAPGEFVRTTAIGSGPPVVFIPGIFGSAFAYRKVTFPLARRGYRCIVIEPLGFGWSSHPRGANYSLTAQSDRLARALDSLGVSHALVVAHSLAASIGFRLAIRRPDLVRGLLTNFAIDTVRGSGQYIQEEQPGAILAALTRLDRGAR